MALTSDPNDPRLTCVARVCGRPAYARGMCTMHYARAFRAGLEPLPRRGCDVDGCSSPRKGFGLCQKHLNRQRRGHPLVGELRILGPHRYRIITRRGHPLAMRNGRVAVHRMVLHDAVAGSRLPCFWCGTPLEWIVGDRSAPGVMFVDHLDHDRSNNDETNLVPSCNSCNAGRMRPDARQPIFAKVGS